MEFKEIHGAVYEGKWVRWHKDDEWVRMKADGTWEDESFNYVAINWAVFKGDQWEIKPEEIYVWGACDDNGDNFLYTVEPTEKDEVGDWKSDEECIPAENMTFPKDKPQKYKLVLMET